MKVSLPGPRGRAAALVVALLFATAGCGADGTDDLVEQLASVDEVIATEDSTAARAELSVLADLVATLESDGTVSASAAADIDAAIDDLLAALPDERPDDPTPPVEEPATTSPAPTEEPEATEDDKDEKEPKEPKEHKPPKEPKEPKPPKEPKDEKDKKDKD